MFVCLFVWLVGLGWVGLVGWLVGWPFACAFRLAVCLLVGHQFFCLVGLLCVGAVGGILLCLL